MIVFASRTGNIRHVLNEKLSDIKSLEISNGLIVEEPYFLFTYTDNLGDIPKSVVKFLQESVINRKNIKGVIASGNRNFGRHFCASATKISSWLDIPIISMLDLRGTSENYEEINKKYKIIIEGGF